MKKLVKLRQRKCQQLFRWDLYFAPYGKEQACYAAGLGSFFEEEAEASGKRSREPGFRGNEVFFNAKNAKKTAKLKKVKKSLNRKGAEEKDGRTMDN